MSFTKIQYVDNETIITAENLNAIQDAILSIDNIYPVGSIYMSLQSNSPASFIGGTWEQITNNFLIGAGDNYTIGTTGGSSIHIHTTGNCTLTEEQIPKLSGNITMHSSENPVAASEFWSPTGVFKNTPMHSYYRAPAAGISSAPSISGISFNAGGGQAHNHGNTGSSSNLPPYLAVYMWKRIE